MQHPQKHGSNTQTHAAYRQRAAQARRDLVQVRPQPQPERPTFSSDSANLQTDTIKDLNRLKHT
jgi:hypothetical protein